MLHKNVTRINYKCKTLYFFFICIIIILFHLGQMRISLYLSRTNEILAIKVLSKRRELQNVGGQKIRAQEEERKIFVNRFKFFKRNIFVSN